MNEYLEKEILRIEKYIQVQEDKSDRIYKQNMEKENRIFKTTVSGMKNSWSRTCKELAIKNKIDSYKKILAHLKTLDI